MLKKVLTIFVAAALLASLTVTAFAEPADTAAPTAPATTAPTDTAAPSAPASTAPAATPMSDDALKAFTARIKEMTVQVKAIRTQLAEEVKLDRKLQPRIRSLKGITKPDPAQAAAYEAELKPLTEQLRDLTQQLKKEDAKKDKKRDQAKIDSLKAAILDVEARIAAVNEKYKDLIAQIHKNNSSRSSLKELRRQLQPMYNGLKPLIDEARNLDRDIGRLIVSLKAALQANDAAKASEIIDGILAKLDLLKANIAKRIAIRGDIQKVLDSYKIQ